MSTPLNIGVVGLGVMGQRMLDRIEAHPRLKTTVVWDADAQALQRTLAARPALRAADSAGQLIATPGLHSLYIATPPAAHMALSEAAFDAGLAVLCEKPLTVDFEAAHRCIERIEREGRRAAVNFSLASSPGLQALQQAFGAGVQGLGAIAAGGHRSGLLRLAAALAGGGRALAVAARRGRLRARGAVALHLRAAARARAGQRDGQQRSAIRPTASAPKPRCRPGCRWLACRC